jgi:hypothetical protein
MPSRIISARENNLVNRKACTSSAYFCSSAPTAIISLFSRDNIEKALRSVDNLKALDKAQFWAAFAEQSRCSNQHPS